MTDNTQVWRPGRAGGPTPGHRLVRSSAIIAVTMRAIIVDVYIILYIMKGLYVEVIEFGFLSILPMLGAGQGR